MRSTPSPKVTLSFHPDVQADFNSAIAYYEAADGVYLADRFEAEIRVCLAAIKAGPRSTRIIM